VNRLECEGLAVRTLHLETLGVSLGEAAHDPPAI
jgi:hypothetical protein